MNRHESESGLQQYSIYLQLDENDIYMCVYVYLCSL